MCLPLFPHVRSVAFYVLPSIPSSSSRAAARAFIKAVEEEEEENLDNVWVIPARTSNNCQIMTALLAAEGRDGCCCQGSLYCCC